MARVDRAIFRSWEAAMVYRICLALTCVFALAGCYTQIRPPGYETESRVGSASPADTDTVVVYRQYVYNSFDPYGWAVAPYYEPYFPRYPSWAQRGFRWRHAYWTSAYGPWWRGWMRRVLARGRLPAPTYRYRPVDADPIDLHEPRLRIRYTGLRGGEHAPAGTVRKGEVKKTTRRRRAPAASAIRSDSKTEGSGSASRTASKPRDSGGGQSSKPKEDEKQQEKREEKREGKRRRGGMR